MFCHSHFPPGESFYTIDYILNAELRFIVIGDLSRWNLKYGAVSMSQGLPVAICCRGYIEFSESWQATNERFN